MLLISLCRTLILYVLIIFSMRFMGKRQIGQLQPSELVITILISNVATLPIENLDMPLFFGIIPVLYLICFEFATSFISMKNKKLRDIISGRPVLIIENGKINQKALQKLRLTTDDLTESLRSCNAFNLNEVAYAIIETNGTLSVIKNFANQNVTTEMLNITQKNTAIQLTIISDGKILTNNLQKLKLSTDWLLNFLKTNNLQIKNIFIMTADKNKQTFIALKELN